jgi:hypothetical protein
VWIHQYYKAPAQIGSHSNISKPDEEKKVITCENPSCKKSFAVPLKALNLQQTPAEPYFACPFCLTKIKTDRSAQPLQVLEEPQLLENQPKKVETEIKDDPVKKNEKSADCRHHPGYLSERSSKEQIPDECMVCKDIVECMLKKMRE